MFYEKNIQHVRTIDFFLLLLLLLTQLTLFIVLQQIHKCAFPSLRAVCTTIELENIEQKVDNK